MSYKENNYEFSTQLSVQEIARLLEQASRKIGVEQRSMIPGFPSDIAWRVSGRTAPFSPFIFLIDIYVWNNGTNRTVSLIALGSDTATYFRTSLTRERGVYAQMKASIQKRNQILRFFQDS